VVEVGFAFGDRGRVRGSLRLVGVPVPVPVCVATCELSAKGSDALLARSSKARGGRWAHASRKLTDSEVVTSPTLRVVRKPGTGTGTHTAS